MGREEIEEEIKDFVFFIDFFFNFFFAERFSTKLLQVQPDVVPIRNLNNAISFKSEKVRILDLDLEFKKNPSTPVEKLIK